MVLATDGQLSVPDVVGALVFVLYAGSRVLVLTTAIRDRNRFRELMRLPSRFWAMVRRRSPRDGIARSDSAADELFDSFQLVRGRLRVLLPRLATHWRPK